jgi:hypothetical protein
MDRTVVWAIVIVVVFVGIAVLVSYLQRKAEGRAWGELASQLGLAFEPGANPWAPPAVKGTYGGHALVLDTFSRLRWHGQHANRKLFTRAVMTVSNPADLQLALYEESVFSQMGKILGVTDIQVGDAAIDRRFTIKGRPEEQIKTLLTSEALRQSLLSVRSINLSLEGTTIRYEHPGVEKDVTRLRSVLDLLSEFATAVEQIG